MRILGVDLQRGSPDRAVTKNTLVRLDAAGKVCAAEQLDSLPAVAARVGEWVGEEPFLLAVNVPVVVPARQARSRPVENVVRRRLGFRLAPGGRAALSAGPPGVPGETLLAGLAAAGRPCLPYPDRTRRLPGLIETDAGLVLKVLLWSASPLALAREGSEATEPFRAYTAPAYRPVRRSRGGWAERLCALDMTLNLLSPVEGYDTEPARESLHRAGSDDQVEHAAGLLDAALLAGTARRYLEAPQACVFLGDQENGYLVLPADAHVRRLALSDAARPRGRLFPRASLRERLGAHAQIKPVGLFAVPGRGQCFEAVFHDCPHYEFDNLDEMLWWKHCRHLSGPGLPTDGLQELHVTLDGPGLDEGAAALSLMRSRHRTLSFRFEPPAGWRARVPTRDGRTYPFRVQRAVYETLPADD